MDLIDVFVAYEVKGDDREHLGDIIGVYEDKGIARAVSVGKGPWGTDGKVLEEKAIRDVDGKLYILDSDYKPGLEFGDEVAKEALRSRALSKLTKAEAEALGLKWETST